MSKTLVVLVLAVIVLSWNFIFTDKKKVELTDPAKVLQGLTHGIKYKSAVLAYWQERKKLPDAETWQKQDKQIESDLSKSLIDKIEIGVDAPGSVTFTFRNKETIQVEKDINGTKIILIPKTKGERLSWTCSGTMPQEYMPKKCTQDE